MALLFYKVYY